MMNIDPNVLLAVVGIWGLLVVSSVLVFILKTMKPRKDYTELVQRIRSWWVMIVIFTVALLSGANLSIWLFGFISFLALKEYFSMIPTRRADRRVLLWAYLAIPVQYYIVGMHWYGMFIIFIPVYMFLLLPIRMMFSGQTGGFINSASTLHWGLMSTVFSLSHAAFAYTLPKYESGGAGGAGILLFLVLLTQFNDVAQYTWGKLLGKRKVIPKVSPNKTWEGLVGGVVTVTVLATLIGPYLTPLTVVHALFGGLIIAVAGFFGDITISALKRDIGVKDTGNVLPGHGGILDRVDSLTFSAPLFFHYIWYLYY